MENFEKKWTNQDNCIYFENGCLSIIIFFDGNAIEKAIKAFFEAFLSSIKLS